MGRGYIRSNVACAWTGFAVAGTILIICQVIWFLTSLWRGEIINLILFCAGIAVLFLNILYIADSIIPRLTEDDFYECMVWLDQHVFPKNSQRSEFILSYRSKV
jgi:hypothetical protein